VWLVNLNSNRVYDNKIIAYGSFWDGLSHIELPLVAGLTVITELGLSRMNNRLVGNDGIVPISSAHYDGHNIKATRTFYSYNHYRMAKGNDDENDKLFSNYLKPDLLDISFSTLVVSPSVSLEFGNTPLNVTSEKTLTLTNSGNKIINITKISLEGANSNQFTIINPTVSTFQIKPGSVYDIVICFIPNTEGIKMATLNINNDSDNESPTKKIILNGNSSKTNKKIEINPANFFNFGVVNQNAFVDKTFTIKNTGTTEISITGISISGSDAGQFIIILMAHKK